jgi:hypothetical protein
LLCAGSGHWPSGKNLWVPFVKVATTPEVVELREGHKYVESSTCARQLDGPAEVETDDKDEKDEDELVELAAVEV